MLPFRNGRSGNWGFFWLLIWLVSFLLINGSVTAAKPKSKNQKLLTTTPTGSPGEQSLTNIPLPIGHEAKGLVLPDFDLEGRLRGRFEAERARRLDEEHIAFRGLKITTYTPENKIDLTVEMSESVLDLKTRILSSKERRPASRP